MGGAAGRGAACLLFYISTEIRETGGDSEKA